MQAVISLASFVTTTNQSFFSKFTCQVGKPWLTVDGLYLLFDFAHLLKSVRNNWITEKQHKIAFDEWRSASHS